jgi:hypothetical protein
MTPANAVKMVKYLSRQIVINGPIPPEQYSTEREGRPFKENIIWNGNVGDENCLTGYSSPMAKQICDPFVIFIPDNLDNWDPEDLPAGGSGEDAGNEGLTW